MEQTSCSAQCSFDGLLQTSYRRASLRHQPQVLISITFGDDLSYTFAKGGGANVPVDNLLKTPQFWLLWSTATLLATGGMGLMSVAKPMIQNVFTDAMPALVTTGFASAYLMAMAGGNLGGRIAWAAVSDKIGRWNTFQMFTFVAIPIYAGLPFLINQCVSNPSGSLAPIYLGGFCASTVLVSWRQIKIAPLQENYIRRSP